MAPAAEPVAVASGEGDLLHVGFRMLSGKSETLELSRATPLEAARTAVEGMLGVPGDCQQWVLHGKDVSFHQDATLADTGIRDGDQVGLLHTGCVPLMPLPEAFQLELSSVRLRFLTRYSSSFTVIYKIFGEVSAGRLRFEPWRKNDHDRYVYDSKAGTVSGMHSHWMAGSSEFSRELGSEDPLSELLRSWRSPAKRVLNEAECFWLRPPRRAADSPPSTGGASSEERPPWRINRDQHGDERQLSPDFEAVPGWFIAPSEDCVEVKVDIECFGKRIVRLLLDSEGVPLRAAISGLRMAGVHEDIEEFDVTITEPDPKDDS